jgi:hypothetical protein
VGAAAPPAQQGHTCQHVYGSLLSTLLGTHHHPSLRPTPALLPTAAACSAHCGLEPSSTQLAHLLKAAGAAKEFVPDCRLAWRYSLLAAERGVRAAAAAVAHAYATGGAWEVVGPCQQHGYAIGGGQRAMPAAWVCHRWGVWGK